ncbi:Interferon-induced guanylate-binding protein 1 [Symbiodinium microadriaticum]|uniref:Interferon-induced guanylate-binding protein 1 n=1 Tax=Symbiodinium microadriaticum TaxID=2951 RepID=A0A1Q9BS51_SYMMI|nr:Interferon-induced guanylate-binding protein 1 [Symbiodinium microadriaticum]CAE7945052.1 GBP1 [Symbiodinium sp. KB8]
MADGDPAYFSGPLQLIRIDDDGKCHLQDNAAAILNQIPGRIVGIAGLYRTGKSFLLNRLLGLQDGFEIGPTINPCTRLGPEFVRTKCIHNPQRQLKIVSRR